MKSYLKNVGLVVAGSVLAVSTASAAIPAIVGTTLATVQTDSLAMVDLVWPVVVTLFGSMLLFKVFKRAGNKI